jgi:hypothetical protein
VKLFMPGFSNGVWTGEIPVRKETTTIIGIQK